MQLLDQRCPFVVSDPQTLWVQFPQSSKGTGSDTRLQFPRDTSACEYHLLGDNMAFTKFETTSSPDIVLSCKRAQIVPKNLLYK
jgi:hypothetical protein